jgi:hypothetical protein
MDFSNIEIWTATGQTANSGNFQDLGK